MNEISNNIKPQSWSMKGYWIALIVCTVIIAGTYNSAFSYIAFVLSVITIVLLTEDDALCFMMLIMSFANIFKRSVESQSFFTYLMLLYILWFLMKRWQISKKFSISLIGLSIYLILQMCFSANILRMIKFIANFLFIYLAVSHRFIHNTKKIYFSYISGIVLSSSVAALKIIPNLNNYISTEDMWIQNEQVSRFAGMYSDPNYYSTNIIISLCLIIILNHKKYLSFIPSIALSGIMITFVGMTLSKSAFLMLILPLELLLYSKFSNRNYLVFVGVLIAGIVGVSLIFSGKVTIFNNVLLRINNATNIESFTTGRTRIWKEYCEFFLHNIDSLLFGKGFGAEILGKHAAHNTYIDLIYYLGIIGTILVMFVFCELISIQKSAEKLNLLNYSIWICIGIMYFFLSELFYFDWSFHIIIAIYILRVNMNQVNEEKYDKKIYM